MSADEDERSDSTEIALINSMTSESLSGIATDVGEIALDSLLEDGLLKDIPIVGWLPKLYSAGKGIHERLFLRKVVSFLSAFADVEEEDKKDFVEKLTKDAGSKDKAGAVLMLYLDRIDDFEKSQMLGSVYLRRLVGQISYGELKRFASILDRCFVEDIRFLNDNLRNLSVGDPAVLQSLESLGLIIETGQDYGGLSQGANRSYELTKVGTEFMISVSRNL